MQASKKAKMISSDFKRKVHFLLRIGKKKSSFLGTIEVRMETYVLDCIAAVY